MIGKILILLFLLLCVSAQAKDTTYGNIVISEVVSIYDADTFRVNIKGYPSVISERMPIRVLGVDAPELRGKCEFEKRAARIAKQFTVARLRAGKVIELRNIQRGKYFRILAHVYIDGISLGQELINNGYARPYDGGKRLGWCAQ